MEFQDLYRDVYSRLNLTGDDHSIYREDIVKAINDAIKSQRLQYIKEGWSTEFSETETLYALIDDFDYPFLRSSQLSKEPSQELPINMSFLTILGYKTKNEIKNRTQSFSEGDIASKGRILYQAQDDISNLNTYTLTFDNDIVKDYKRLNGIKYQTGDIIKDVSDDNYYKVNTNFTATIDQQASSITELDKLYWKKIGLNYINVSVYPFARVQQMQVFNEINNSECVSVNNDKIYVTDGLEKLTVTYIPKWTRVSDPETELSLPDAMIPQVKQQALGQIAQKLGIQIEQQNDE